MILIMERFIDVLGRQWKVLQPNRVAYHETMTQSALSYVNLRQVLPTIYIPELEVDSADTNNNLVDVFYDSAANVNSIMTLTYVRKKGYIVLEMSKKESLEDAYNRAIKVI